MTISVKVTDGQMKVMLMYAEMKNMTIAELMEYVAEWMEDELDAKAADEALDDLDENPGTMTHEEAMRELGFR